MYNSTMNLKTYVSLQTLVTRDLKIQYAAGIDGAAHQITAFPIYLPPINTKNRSE